MNSERIILRITSFPVACGGVSERMKSTIFLNSRSSLQLAAGRCNYDFSIDR